MNRLTEAQAKTFLKNLKLSNFRIVPNHDSNVHVPVIEIPQIEFESILNSTRILYELNPAKIWNEQKHDYDFYLDIGLTIDNKVKSFAVSLTPDFVYALLQSKQVGFITQRKEYDDMYLFKIQPKYFETLQEFLMESFRF